MTAWYKKYREYLLSPQWAEIRLELFVSRGRKCERCVKTHRLQIHHKHYRNLFNEEPEDLEILCSGCHKKEHNIGIKKPKKKKKQKSLAQKLKSKKRKKTLKSWLKQLGHKRIIRK